MKKEVVILRGVGQGFGYQSTEPHQNYTRVACPCAEEILATSMGLSIHEDMDEAHIHRMADALEKVAAHYRRREFKNRREA